VLDYLFKDTFFTQRLGEEGAKALSSSMLLFVPGIAALYACLTTKEKGVVKLDALAEVFAKGVKSISPTIGVCLFGYMIGALFADLNVAEEMQAFILGFELNKLALVLFICIIACILGMVIPGSSIVVLFGPVFITSLASVGVDPVLAAAMLPCVCGVMCGITPPLGLGMYAGMTISGAEFNKTFKNNLWWCAAQFVLEVVVLMGFLPVLGL
jgi:TRAP-type C4-dicarboxylate transport system permease large subunit